MSLSVQQLGPQMTRRLAELESEIEGGLRSFIRVGQALREIHDQHLYHAEWDSFGAYCRERWALSRSRAYQLVDAAEVCEALASTTVDTMPENEAQARQLAPLKDRPAEMLAAWREASAGADITARGVRAIVITHLSQPPTPSLAISANGAGKHASEGSEADSGPENAWAGEVEATIGGSRTRVETQIAEVAALLTARGFDVSTEVRQT
jgi:hypothetical protein